MTGKSQLIAHTEATFVDLVERFVALTRAAGFRATAFSGEEPVFFRCLKIEQQAAIVENFRRYVQVCETVVKKGGKLGDDRRLLRQMIETLELRSRPDVFDLIQPMDILEIYDGNFVQLFRNLSFFAVCSYSLDEVLCRPFWELYERDDDYTAKLIALGLQVFTTPSPVTLPVDIGVHEQVELGGQRWRWQVECRFISSLYDGEGRIMALVNVIKPVKFLSGDRP
jgi:hypothetical protein